MEQVLLYLDADAARDDPQNRRDDDDRRIVAELARQRARASHFPDAVERAFDVVEYLDDRPEQHDHADRRDHAAFGPLDHRVGECQHLIYQDPVLRELLVQVLVQSGLESEPFHYAEDQGRDRYERHQRVESQRGRADQNAVLPDALSREDEDFELSDGPPRAARLVLVLFLHPDVLGDVLDDFLNPFAHCVSIVLQM